MPYRTVVQAQPSGCKVVQVTTAIGCSASHAVAQSQSARCMQIDIHFILNLLQNFYIYGVKYKCRYILAKLRLCQLNFRLFTSGYRYPEIVPTLKTIPGKFQLLGIVTQKLYNFHITIPKILLYLAAISWSFFVKVFFIRISRQVSLIAKYMGNNTWTFST